MREHKAIFVPALCSARWLLRTLTVSAFFFAHNGRLGFEMQFALLFESGVLAALGLAASAGPWADSHTPTATPTKLAGRQDTTAFRSDASLDRWNKVAPRRPLRGDFPEYRPGFRATGKETFWR
jgi:hypothetical protein